EPGSDLPTARNSAAKRKSVLQKINGRKVLTKALGAKRLPFKAKAVLHKNDRYVKGTVLNVSKTGIFIESEREIFKENETVRLYNKPQGLKKQYSVIATVTRYNNDPRYPRGYGL